MFTIEFVLGRGPCTVLDFFQSLYNKVNKKAVTYDGSDLCRAADLFTRSRDIMLATAASFGHHEGEASAAEGFSFVINHIMRKMVVITTADVTEISEKFPSFANMEQRLRVNQLITVTIAEDASEFVDYCDAVRGGTEFIKFIETVITHCFEVRDKGSDKWKIAAFTYKTIASMNYDISGTARASFPTSIPIAPGIEGAFAPPVSGSAASSTSFDASAEEQEAGAPSEGSDDGTPRGVGVPMSGRAPLLRRAAEVPPGAVDDLATALAGALTSSATPAVALTPMPPAAARAISPSPRAASATRDGSLGG